MEQVNSIELTDENVYPDETVLRKVLGASFGSYLKLLEILDRHGTTREWRYYKDGEAWLCKVRKKNKTVLWMSAWKGFMKATAFFLDRYAETPRAWSFARRSEARAAPSPCRSPGAGISLPHAG